MAVKLEGVHAKLQAQMWKMTSRASNQNTQNVKETKEQVFSREEILGIEDKEGLNGWEEG